MLEPVIIMATAPAIISSEAPVAAQPLAQESESWTETDVADSVTQNQEISVQYKLAQPAPAGHHVHVSLSAKPITSETVKDISFDKIVMSWPDADGKTGNASLSTKGVGTGEYYISFWGVTKDHEYDGNGIIVRIAANVSPDTFPQTFSSMVPVQYVLEVPAGWAERHGVSTGDQLIW